MKYRLPTILVFSILCINSLFAQESITISGYIKDAKTGENLYWAINSTMSGLQDPAMSEC